MIQSSVRDNPSDFIYFMGFADVVIWKIWNPLYFTQLMISTGSETMNVIWHSIVSIKNLQKNDLVRVMMNNMKVIQINALNYYDLERCFIRL